MQPSDNSTIIMQIAVAAVEEQRNMREEESIEILYSPNFGYYDVLLPANMTNGSIMAF